MCLAELSGLCCCCLFIYLLYWYKYMLSLLRELVNTSVQDPDVISSLCLWCNICLYDTVWNMFSELCAHQSASELVPVF